MQWHIGGGICRLKQLMSVLSFNCHWSRTCDKIKAYQCLTANAMFVCVSEETGWERLPTGAGSLVQSVRPATAAPAGETSAPQTSNPKDWQDINTTKRFKLVLMGEGGNEYRLIIHVKFKPTEVKEKWCSCHVTTIFFISKSFWMNVSHTGELMWWVFIVSLLFLIHMTHKKTTKEVIFRLFLYFLRVFALLLMILFFGSSVFSEALT